MSYQTIELTAERVREVLSYDESSGIFTWRMKRGRCGAGSIAGNQSRGYVQIHVDGRQYFAHRLAWLYTTGDWPVGEIDHINGDRSDNRWVNLRDVSRAVNQQNRRTAQRNNKTSKYLGVSRAKEGRPWRAYITLGGRGRLLGCFDTEDQAHTAYVEAKRRLHEGCTL